MHAVNSDLSLETLLARTIGDESGYPMSALLAAPIPAGIVRYMRAEIINRLAEDLSRAPHFVRVASPTAGPDPVRDALLAHAAGQYIFPREEFLAMLENACRFTENYLCRPRWTLASFLFVDQPAITTEMLLRKLEYITDYAYLPQLLRRMVTQSRRQVITSNECVATIARIDDAVVSEHSPRELALLAKPIFRFFLLTPDIGNKPIPLRALLLFLADKQLAKLHEYAGGVWHIRGKSEITIEEFASLSEDFATGRPASEPERVAAEVPQVPPAQETATEQPPAEPEQQVPTAEVNIQESAPAEIPLPEEPAWQPPPVETQPPPEPVQESLPFVDTAAAQPPERQEATPEIVAEEVTPDEPAARDDVIPEIPASPTLEQMITGDLRRRFINVICGKDAEFYDLVIARLDDIHSWPEASAYIRELFEINSIDPFDETAVAFTDLVQTRCDQSGAAER